MEVVHRGEESERRRRQRPAAADRPRRGGHGWLIEWCSPSHQPRRCRLRAAVSAGPVKPICGAKTRKGGACQCRPEPGKKRCRLHGGLSTGPRTAEGRAKISEAQRTRHAVNRRRPVMPAPSR
nr:HGGxSTG domain-containing protein [Rhodovulum sulfidophilum]